MYVEMNVKINGTINIKMNSKINAEMIIKKITVITSDNNDK